MVFKDLTGNVLKEGDQLLIPMGLGQASIATVVRTESGLKPQNPQPAIIVSVEMIFPSAPNGFVPSVVKVAEAVPKQESSELSKITIC